MISTPSGCGNGDMKSASSTAVANRDLTSCCRSSGDRGWRVAAQRFAPSDEHGRVDDQQRQDGRRAAGGEEFPKAKPADLADQDVLRVADERRRRTGVGGTGPRDQVRARGEPATLQAR